MSTLGFAGYPGYPGAALTFAAVTLVALLFATRVRRFDA